MKIMKIARITKIRRALLKLNKKKLGLSMNNAEQSTEWRIAIMQKNQQEFW